MDEFLPIFGRQIPWRSTKKNSEIDQRLLKLKRLMRFSFRLFKYYSFTALCICIFIQIQLASLALQRQTPGLATNVLLFCFVCIQNWLEFHHLVYAFSDIENAAHNDFEVCREVFL